MKEGSQELADLLKSKLNEAFSASEGEVTLYVRSNQITAFTDPASQELSSQVVAMADDIMSKFQQNENSPN